MEEKHWTTKVLEETVKELLEIVESAKLRASRQSEVEEFLISKKQRVKHLGQIVAGYSGISHDSREALRLGALIVINFMNQNAGSLQFLTGILSRSISREDLKAAIIEFLSASDKQMKQDREYMKMQIKKELEVLQHIKSTSKKANRDPEWVKEIEDLEKKLARMAVSFPPARGDLPDMQRQAPAVLERSQSEMLRSPALSSAVPTACKSGSRSAADLKEKKQKKRTQELILGLSRLTCFCNFQKKAAVSPHTIVQELLLHIIETNRICYLSVLPRLCKSLPSLSIELCSPKSFSEAAIQEYQQYIIKMLKNIVDITKKEKPLVEDLQKVFYKEKRLSKQILQEVLLSYSPKRHRDIAVAISSEVPGLFYINIVRVLYLIINDVVLSCLTIQAVNTGTTLIMLLSETNKAWHARLRRRWQHKEKKKQAARRSRAASGTQALKSIRVPAAEMPVEPHTPALSSEPLSLAPSFVHVTAQTLREDPKTMVKTISQGIFSTRSLLSGYFATYHALRTSILQSVSKVISKRIAGSAQRGCPESIITEDTARKDLLRLFRQKALLFLDSTLEIREFVEAIPETEFAKSGLDTHSREVRLFFLAALPLFVFSVASLS